MPPRILIADDYTDTRELLRLALEMAGYEVREARNGRECIEMALDDAHDLALIDLSMPVLDGWATLKQLRSDERTAQMRCIAITAAAAGPDRHRAMEAGFDGYISKPFRTKDVLELVTHVLSKGTA